MPTLSFLAELGSWRRLFCGRGHWALAPVLQSSGGSLRLVVSWLVLSCWFGASCSHILSISLSTLSGEAHIHPPATLTHAHLHTEREEAEVEVVVGGEVVEEGLW